MKALSKKLLRDIQTLRLQIIAMSLLISCGVGVLLASWSSYDSLRKAQQSYYQKYNFADIFVELSRAPQHLVARAQQIPGVRIAEGRIAEDALIDLPNQDEPALGRVLSYSGTSRLNKIYLRQGRFPEKAATLEVLVHESFAKAHDLLPGDSFDIVVKGQKRKVHVSGIGISPDYVYALSPIAMFPDDQHYGIFWMAEEDLAQISNMQGSFNSLTLQLTNSHSDQSVKSQLDTLLEQFGSLGAYDRSQQISHLFVEDEIRQQRSMSFIIPTIFIAVAIFILHTVINRLIDLQRSQIAALKSLGYSSKELAFYYWKLISLILLFGLGPGVIFAIGIGRWYAVIYEQYFRFPQISFAISAQAFGIGVAAIFLPGWLATLQVLYRIFHLQPAEAMRPPAPANYKKKAFESWGFFRQSGFIAKIIIRNIVSRPWRSVLSVLGLAAATSIVVNGGFWTDIIDFIIQRQFFESSREDLEVRFVHPRRIDVLSEISRIEGVYLIEGARTVPVRLHFRQIEKNTAITASESISTLRRILDKNGRTLIPREGQVLLSQYYSKKYDLKVGDELIFEVSDKTRPPFTAPIGGFVEDVVGSGIYATKEDLTRWLQEVPSINTVYLKTDPSQNSRIYIRLKQFPEVLSVGIKDSVLKSFSATLSGMIFTFTLILIAFATLISASVLFNMMRINLSERSWELASLRIIGFSVSPVFQILFLEIGLQVITALAPGLVFGYGLSYLSTKWIHTDAFVFPLVVNNKTYALATVVIISCYLIAGIFLYTKIRALNLTAALKARE